MSTAGPSKAILAGHRPQSNHGGYRASPGVKPWTVEQETDLRHMWAAGATDAALAEALGHSARSARSKAVKLGLGPRPKGTTPQATVRRLKEPDPASPPGEPTWADTLKKWRAEVRLAAKRSRVFSSSMPIRCGGVVLS